MLAGTDGLPPWLDIDRFHVSRRSLTPYPTAMVQGSLELERLALPTMSPWWRLTFSPSKAQQDM